MAIRDSYRYKSAPVSTPRYRRMCFALPAAIFSHWSSIPICIGQRDNQVLGSNVVQLGYYLSRLKKVALRGPVRCAPLCAPSDRQINFAEISNENCLGEFVQQIERISQGSLLPLQTTE